MIKKIFTLLQCKKYKINPKKNLFIHPLVKFLGGENRTRTRSQYSLKCFIGCCG